MIIDRLVAKLAARFPGVPIEALTAAATAGYGAAQERLAEMTKAFRSSADHLRFRGLEGAAQRLDIQASGARVAAAWVDLARREPDPPLSTTPSTGALER